MTAEPMHVCPGNPDGAHCLHYTPEEMARAPGKAAFVEQACCYCPLVIRRYATATHHTRMHGANAPVST